MAVVDKGVLERDLIAWVSAGVIEFLTPGDERAESLDVRAAFPPAFLECFEGLGVAAVQRADRAPHQHAPLTVVRTFSGPGRAFCRVHSDEAARYSEYLFATLAGEPLPPWRPSIWEILDSLLGPFDVQDLVAEYLQAERGYIALPARYKDSTIAYEYILRHPDDGHTVAVQVKTGDERIDTNTLPNSGGLRWIVFSARQRYPSELPPHVEALNPDDLMEFIQNRPNALPPVTGFWLSVEGGTPVKRDAR